MGWMQFRAVILSLGLTRLEGGTWLLVGVHVVRQSFGAPPAPISTPPPGYTPLHVAVLRRDLELVQLLLRAGADPDWPVGAPKIPQKYPPKRGWGVLAAP